MKVMQGGNDTCVLVFILFLFFLQSVSALAYKPNIVFMDGGIYLYIT